MPRNLLTPMSCETCCKLLIEQSGGLCCCIQASLVVPTWSSLPDPGGTSPGKRCFPAQLLSLHGYWSPLPHCPCCVQQPYTAIAHSLFRTGLKKCNIVAWLQVSRSLCRLACLPLTSPRRMHAEASIRPVHCFK